MTASRDFGAYVPHVCDLYGTDILPGYSSASCGALQCALRTRLRWCFFIDLSVELKLKKTGL